ncbi:MAG: hypothetical protein MJZ22_05260 [Candidatus Saccharibacteria bacterium]|nr:hypothetical protein [Candidatus Saccharibacteria bacterium]
MKRNLTLAFLFVFILGGCYCKDRYFKSDLYPVTDNWSVRVRTVDVERCSGSDYVICYIHTMIEQKFLDEDSTKNMAVHIDSAEYVIGDRYYKQVNDDKEFERARKVGTNLRNKNLIRSFGSVMPFSKANHVNDSAGLPLIKRDVKTIYVTVYVSFVYPEDGHVESRKIETELHESIKSTLYLWRFFDY